MECGSGGRICGVYIYCDCIFICCYYFETIHYAIAYRTRDCIHCYSFCCVGDLSHYFTVTCKLVCLRPTRELFRFIPRRFCYPGWTRSLGELFDECPRSLDCLR